VVTERPIVYIEATLARCGRAIRIENVGMSSVSNEIESLPSNIQGFLV